MVARPIRPRSTVDRGSDADRLHARARHLEWQSVTPPRSIGAMGLWLRELAGPHEGVRDVPDLGVAVPGRPGQGLQRLVGGEFVALHQDARGPFDDRTGLP